MFVATNVETRAKPLFRPIILLSPSGLLIPSTTSTREKLINIYQIFIGTLCDGGLLIAEAGREEEKSQRRAIAKAEAAQRLAQLKGGVYWLGTNENLSECRHYNLIYLHARRRSFSTYQEIVTTLPAQWPWGRDI